MASAQSRFFSEASGTSVEIETSGRTIRPLIEIPTQLVNEAKLTFDGNGLHSTAVDPANVGMYELQVRPGAFEAYDVLGGDELTIGADLTELKSSLSDARLGKSTDDPVDLDIDSTRTLVGIERDYDTTTLSRTDELLNLDPDAIRKLPDVPDMNLSWSAEMDVAAFADAVGYIATDHVAVAESDGNLILKGEAGDDEFTRSTRIDCGAIATAATDDPEPGAVSLFSMDYLGDFAAGLKKAKATSLRIRWGDEFPLFLEFERRDDGDLLYDGQYMLAPRFQSGGDA